MACINPKDILTEDRLRAAFNTFDIDRSGNISMDEIKNAICAGKLIDDKVWASVMSEVDNNNDDEITFPEFKEMMERIFNIGSSKKANAQGGAGNRETTVS